MPASLFNCPAPAKLNLFLHVTGRRADGYHLLQTAFQLIDRDLYATAVLSGNRNFDGRIHHWSTALKKVCHPLYNRNSRLISTITFE